MNRLLVAPHFRAFRWLFSFPASRTAREAQAQGSPPQDSSVARNSSTASPATSRLTMKIVGALCFVLGCSAISASTIPRTPARNQLSESRQGQGVNHWVADPIAKEAFPLTKATGARGGGELNIKHNTSLWAALGFNCVGALCAAFKADLIGAHLMTAGGEVSGVCSHFLAIMWAGAAAHTFLSIQDGSQNVVAVSRKVNVATMGLACLLGVWQYSQGVYDHQHAVAAIAITGVITGALVKGHCDTCK